MSRILLLCATLLALVPTGFCAALFPRSDGQVTFTTRDTNGAATQLWRVQTVSGALPEHLNARLDALALFPGVHYGPITVSPDGAWYVFSSERFDADNAGYSGTTITRADFSVVEAIRYTNQPGGTLTTLHHDGIPVIASGGNLVVFVARGPQHLSDLYSIQRQGGAWSAPVLLTGVSTNTYNYWPCLSADGTKVAFNAGPTSFPASSLCEVRVDGTGFRVLITKDGGPPGMEIGPAVQSPAYAPDGSLVFEAEWGGGERVWRLPIGGGPPVLVQPNYNNDNSPIMLPDGRVVSLLVGLYHQVKVMDLDGGSGLVLTPESSPILQPVPVEDIGIGCGAMWGPNLHVEFDGSLMEVIWPTRFASFTLQASTGLPTGWSNLVSGTNYAAFANTNAFRFFRLAK